MTTGCVIETTRVRMMPSRPEFTPAVPETAAPGLDRDTIHLWRIPYAPGQGRAPLRTLLGAYLGTDAAAVRLETEGKGKPRLRADATPCTNDRALTFNWSHSVPFALVAVARGDELGVDIERLGKRVRVLEIARRFFDPDEAKALSGLAGEALDLAFISLWCAKEAVLKSRGEGLSFGLARLAFERSGEAEWVLARVDPRLGRRGQWQLAGFEAAPGYRGALAWRGPARVVHTFRPA